ncbi:MAG: phage tail protein [Eubacteriales bacterium]|nr:phage tail protein [Eubacteriales bacterium]
MANPQYPLLYDGKTRALKAVLTNAGKIGYKSPLNDLASGGFELPATDPKNTLIDGHDLIEFTDGKRGKILMRVIEQPEDEGGEPGTTVPYTTEGAQATLLDDLFFGYQEIGGTDMRTAACIEWVLSKQSTARWVLYECDFDFAYSYVMQNNNLLTLLYSLATCILTPYRWVFDTSVYPWRVSLKAVAESRECGIVYGRNLGKITRSWDAKALVNRLYCAGYGEGTNLLTIRKVNGGVPYVQDDDSVAKYGVKAGLYTDKAIESAETLLACARAALETAAKPVYTYTATMADLYEQTGLDFDKIDEGRIVWVYDRDRGSDFEARVASINRSDIAADPYDTEVEISEVAADVSGSISDLAGRIGVTELYSQGATQVYSERYADNADASHPAAWSHYVDEDARTVNSVKLRITLEKFRAYSTAAASGGGSAQTSGSGGAASATQPQVVRSGAVSVSGPIDDDGNNDNYTGYAEGAASHRHWRYHRHGVSVSITIPSFTLSVPGHSHSVNIPAHTHPITYGIYEGNQASGYTLAVDGQTVPASEIANGVVDIAPYLSVDDEGRIRRGTYHSIVLTPSGMTRVVMEKYCRLYIQSIGGGVL